MAHARRILTARLDPAIASSPILIRALDDELDLLRDHARSRCSPSPSVRWPPRARRIFRRGDKSARALALEALDVAAGRDRALCVALVRPDLDDLGRLSALGGAVVDGRRPSGWIGDLAADPADTWRSEWLRLCARHEEPGLPAPAD